MTPISRVSKRVDFRISWGDASCIYGTVDLEISIATCSCHLRRVHAARE